MKIKIFILLLFISTSAICQRANPYKIKADGDGTYSNYFQETKIASIAEPSSLLDSMVFWYDFNETSGDSLYDSHVNKINGKINGSVTVNNSANLGKAYDFGGPSTAYIELNDSDLLDWTDTMTIAVWINPDALGWYAFLVRELTNGSDGNFAAMNPSGDIFFWENVSNTALSSNPEISAGSWQCIIYELEGTTRNLYHNGELVRTDTNGLSPDVVNDFFQIGRTVSNNSRDQYDGKMSQMVMWKRTLTQNEIGKYSAGIDNYSDLIIYIK